MPLMLAIDTSTASASLALCRDDLVLAEVTWRAGREHSRSLTQQIRNILHLSAVSPREIDEVAVALGPGSFSGIRVGLAEAKGLSLALGLPLVGIPTLDVIAWQAAPLAARVLAVLPAGREQMYASEYAGLGADQRRVGEYRIVSLDEAACWGAGRLVAGEGWDALQNRVGTPLHTLPGGHQLRRAVFLAELGRRRLHTDRAEELHMIEPLYLRRSAAEEKRLAVEGTQT